MGGGVSFVWSELGLCEGRVTGKDGEFDWYVQGQVRLRAHNTH